MDLKRNLNIVLTSEDFKYVLVEECPINPVDDTDEEIKGYEKWVKADVMALCYILPLIEKVLQHQHQPMTSAYNMLKSLKEMFREENGVANHTAMKALLTTNMVEGSYVKDHVLNIMSYLNELEKLGPAIENEYQGEMILHTLLNKFQHFLLNYNMYMMDLSLAK